MRRVDKWRQVELFQQDGELLENHVAEWLQKIHAEFSVFVSDEGIAEIRMLNGVKKPLVADHAGEQSTPLSRRASKEIEGVSEGHAKKLQTENGPLCTHAFYGKSVEEDGRNSVRRDAQLWLGREGNRKPESITRRRSGAS